VIAALFAVGGCGTDDEPRAEDPRPQSDEPRARTVSLEIVGDEYESPDGTPLNGSAGTHCPPTNEVPSIEPECWTWEAEHLGEGTATLVYGSSDPENMTWTVRLEATNGDVLRGDVAAKFRPDPSPNHEVGHVNSFPQRLTITGGTGALADVAGELSGVGRSTVVAVDTATGIAHKTVVVNLDGELTFDD
jgi:hypothetical protein